MASRDEIQWRVEGKKFNKRKVAQIQDDLPIKDIGELFANGGGIFEFLRRQKEHVKKVLANKGFDSDMAIPMFRGKYFAKHQPDNEKKNQLKEEGLLIETDSMEDWAVALWQHAEIALNDNNAIEHRLSSSYEVGRLFQVMKTYAEYGNSQSKAASKPRNIEAAEAIEELAKKEGTAQELWSNFIGDMDAKDIYPVPSDTSTWFCKYRENGKEKTIKFKTFCNNLSKARNKKD